MKFRTVFIVRCVSRSLAVNTFEENGVTHLTVFRAMSLRAFCAGVMVLWAVFGKMRAFIRLTFGTSGGFGK